jgi:hypothetical protein
MLVPYPEGKEFEPGHGQLGNWQVGVTAKGATNIVDLAIAELGDGSSIIKRADRRKGRRLRGH